MSTIRIMIALMGLLTCEVSLAQDYQPRHEQILRRALSAIAERNCPAEIMTPVVQYQCEQNITAFSSNLQRLGTVTSTTFRGTQPTPNGPCEVYLVIFQNGRLIWMVSTDSDGKLAMLWTPG